MKALQIKAPQKVEIVDAPMPEIRSEKDVLIRIKASSICAQHEHKIFNDLYTGENRCVYPAPRGFPGHEASGEIVKVGKSVKNLAVGDRVAMSGHCGNLHQEYILCNEKWPLKVTSSADFADIAPSELFACMLELLLRADHISASKCVVIGLGPAGLAAIQWLRLLSAEEIIGIDKLEERLKNGAEAGCDSILLSSDKTGIQKLIKTKPGAAIECSGTHDGFRMAFNVASKEALLFGYNDHPFEVNEAEWFSKSLVIRTQFAFSYKTWTRTVIMLNRGFIDPGKVISHRISFNADSYIEAMSLIGSPNTYKIVMKYE